jgi:hypothetical protein
MRMAVLPNGKGGIIYLETISVIQWMAASGYFVMIKTIYIHNLFLIPNT